MQCVAFLRAINVGNRRVKMDRLCALFEDLGFSNVSTFIASGNVIFEAGRGKPTALEHQIDGGLADALGYEVVTFLRTPAQLGGIISNATSLLDEPKKNERLYIALLRSPPAAAARSKITGLSTDKDELAIKGRELYWLIHGGLMDSHYSMADMEKTLGQPTTMRSLTTIRRLLTKLS